MKEYISAGKFKSECLKIMDQVEKKRSKIIITKRKVPIAQLVPLDEEGIQVFGQLKGTLQFSGDLTKPIEEAWDADN